MTPVEQRAVGGADNAHINSAVLWLGADPLNLAVLEEAQEQRLHLQAHLAYFVEKHCAAIGLLEIALPLAMRIGEAAACVPKKFRSEQRVRDPSAVDRDERLASTSTLLVDRFRDDFLTDTALAGDKDLGIRAGGPLDVVFYLPYGPALAY